MKLVKGFLTVTTVTSDSWRVYQLWCHQCWRAAAVRPEIRRGTFIFTFVVCFTANHTKRERERERGGTSKSAHLFMRVCVCVTRLHDALLRFHVQRSIQTQTLHWTLHLRPADAQMYGAALTAAQRASAQSQSDRLMDDLLVGVRLWSHSVCTASHSDGIFFSPHKQTLERLTSHISDLRFSTNVTKAAEGDFVLNRLLLWDWTKHL